MSANYNIPKKGIRMLHGQCKYQIRTIIKLNIYMAQHSNINWYVRVKVESLDSALPNVLLKHRLQSYSIPIELWLIQTFSCKMKFFLSLQR